MLMTASSQKRRYGINVRMLPSTHNGGLSSIRFVLITDGKMSEWFEAHAWKSTALTRADAHEIPPTQFRSNNFRNIDTRRRVPVRHRGRLHLCGRVLRRTDEYRWSRGE